MDRRSLHVLVVAPDPPYPAHDGGSVLILNTIRYLAEHGHRVSLFSPVRTRVEEEEIAFLKRYCEDVRVYPVSVARQVANTLRHPLTPLRTTRRLSNQMHKDIAFTVREGGIDAMLIEHQNMAAYLQPAYTSVTKCVIRFQSLASKSFARTAAHTKVGPHKLVNLTQAVTSKWFEEAIFREEPFHELWFLLPADRAEAVALAPRIASKCRVLPIGVEEKSGETGDGGATIPGVAPADKVIAFVGSMLNPSNQDGARWLARVILPQVRAQVPAAKVLIVGRAAERRLADLAEDHVVLVGDAPDLRPYLARCDVYAVAERGESGVHASGVHVKLLDGLSAARVVVSTPVGTGGIDQLIPGIHYVMARDEDEFVTALVDVLTHAKKYMSVAKRGFELFRERFGVEAAGQAVENRLLALVGGAETDFRESETVDRI